jgi:gas vesicle protein GvpA/GvpJ/GvpM family
MSAGYPVPGRSRAVDHRQESANLADILERVLDKGIVIAGDVRVNLLDIELLTIKIRLLVASVDKAREIGIDWWERDPSLSSGRLDPADDRDELDELMEENRQLRERVRALETRRTARRARHDEEPPRSREPRSAGDG